MAEVRIPFEMQLPSRVLDLSAAFKSSGYQLYVVGGAVRDAVMGIEPHDFDLATNATPTQVTNIVLSMLTGWSADLTGEAFGVIRARHQRPSREEWDLISAELRELCEFEIATFREDLSAGRHPEVRFATIVEDVQRRDLTINALFYDIDRREVVDLVGGLRDIEEGWIRTVGRPEDRFAEDRLRILRAIRFATRFGYVIDEATERAIIEDNNLQEISPERIRDEFLRSLQTAEDVRVLLGLYGYFNMWPQVMPELFVHAPSSLNDRDPIVLLAHLLGNNPVDVIERRLNALKYSDRELRQVSFLLRFRELSDQNAYRLRKLANSCFITNEQIRAYAVSRGLFDARLVEAFIGYQHSVLGDDLLAEGYSGKALGMELERRERELFERLLK